MAENKMNEVANLLSLELNEEFKIKDYDSRYKLSANGLTSWSNNLQQWTHSPKLDDLLTGDNQIIKLDNHDEKELVVLKNRMREVAKLLGLDLDEEFKINDSHHEKYKFSEKGLMVWLKPLRNWIYSSKIEDLLSGDKEIIKLPKPILNSKEKEYLSLIIKPFRDNATITITKRCASFSHNYFIEISIRQYDTNLCDIICLPRFKMHTMYKGMRLNRRYTLELLDL